MCDIRIRDRHIFWCIENLDWWTKRKKEEWLVTEIMYVIVWYDIIFKKTEFRSILLMFFIVFYNQKGYLLR